MRNAGAHGDGRGDRCQAAHGVLDGLVDNTGKFTGKGAVYAAARPHYAEGLLAHLADETGLAPGALVADVGSGTGIFSEQLPYSLRTTLHVGRLDGDL